MGGLEMGRTESPARGVEVKVVARCVPTEAVSHCHACQSELDLHQPDVTDPDRLLGICGGCGAWSLIQIASSGGSAQVVELPGPAALSRTFDTTPKAATLNTARLASFLAAPVQVGG